MEFAMFYEIPVPRPWDEESEHRAYKAVIEEIESHVDGMLSLSGEQGHVAVECESDRALSFVHVTRDLETFTKDELAMLTSFLADRFGVGLVRNPVPDEHPDEDPAFQEELAESAIEAAPRAEAG